jgi:hypothetical protein
MQGDFVSHRASRSPVRQLFSVILLVILCSGERCVNVQLYAGSYNHVSRTQCMVYCVRVRGYAMPCNCESIGLKIRRSQGRGGSTPPPGTMILNVLLVKRSLRASGRFCLVAVLVGVADCTAYTRTMLCCMKEMGNPPLLPSAPLRIGEAKWLWEFRPSRSLKEFIQQFACCGVRMIIRPGPSDCLRMAHNPTMTQIERASLSAIPCSSTVELEGHLSVKPTFSATWAALTSR